MVTTARLTLSLPSPPCPHLQRASFECYFTTYPSIVIRINKVNWCFCQSYNKWIVQASLFFLDFVVHLADVRYCFEHLCTILKSNQNKEIYSWFHHRSYKKIDAFFCKNIKKNCCKACSNGKCLATKQDQTLFQG